MICSGIYETFLYDVTEHRNARHSWLEFRVYTLTELGTCGYLNFLSNEKYDFFHFLFNEFYWGKDD